MSRQEELAIGFKCSEKQWEYLGQMTKRTRAAYVREAMMAYVGAFPAITAVPLHEPPDEPIRHLTLRFIATPAVVAWLDKLPNGMRSYMVRCAINWYRAKEVAAEDRQQVLDLEAASLQPTGSDT